MRIVTLFLSLCLLTSCSNGYQSSISRTNSDFRGFKTDCQGTLKFVDLLDGGSYQKLSRPAGEQNLKVYYESSYGPSLGESGRQGYFCSYVTSHDLSFVSKPGKAYRFYVDESTPSKYKVTVLELIDPGSPEAKPVASNSIQTSIKNRCRPFTRHSSCY